MAVVINEFEVVPAPPTSQTGNPPGSDNGGQAGQAGALTAHDLARLMRRQQERLARLRAY